MPYEHTLTELAEAHIASEKAALEARLARERRDVIAGEAPVCPAEGKTVVVGDQAVTIQGRGAHDRRYTVTPVAS